MMLLRKRAISTALAGAAGAVGAAYAYGTPLSSEMAPALSRKQSTVDDEGLLPTAGPRSADVRALVSIHATGLAILACSLEWSPARLSLSHSLSLSLSPLPQVVLAGLGLWGSISSLGVMQTLLGRSLFVPPMMASGIIFFAGPSPPSPQGFLSGSVCSATISLGALMALQPVFSPVVAQVRTPFTIPAPPIWLPEADLTPSPRNLTASHPRRLGRAPPQAPS